MAYHTSNDRMLGEELRRVEHQYLNTRLTEDEKQKPALVQHIMEKIILPKLSGTFSDVAYTGSSYEYTAVPGKSDYDIQLYLRISGARVEGCRDPAWRKVRGGPSELLDGRYLSTTKARTLVQSEIDQALHEQGRHTFKGSLIHITRSMKGPAITLKVRWASIQLDIDIVVSLKAADLGLTKARYDLVGKPNSCDSRGHMWRVSYSTREVELLRSFHYKNERKVTLLRIVKVIKKHQTQLGSFPSYFYKNLLFLLDKKKPRASWKNPSDLAERFKDMMQLMCDCLNVGELPIHFFKKRKKRKMINYLKGKKIDKMRETADFLKGLISRDKLIELVKAVPEVTSGKTTGTTSITDQLMNFSL